jgi:hypothetical protein
MIKIDPTEKLSSFENSMKGFGEELKNFASRAVDKVKDTAGEIFDDINDMIGF